LVAQQLRTLGEIELRSGDPDQALLHAHKALAACEEAGLKDLAVSVSALLARTLLATGSVREAAEYIESAVHGLLPSTEQSYLVHFARFEVLVALGRSSDAQAALEEAYQILIRTLGGLSDERLSGPLGSVPEHAEIVSAWRSARPAVHAVSLRSASGKEMIDVLWTLDAPADAVAKNPVERRRIQIARLLDEAEQEGAVATAKDLAAALAVSASTVRRDLAALRKQ
jgi:tetratricopeptide (TPR) repeat protein